MQKKIFETIVGFLVIAVAAWFLISSYKIKENNSISAGYKVRANFQDIGGISKGSEVVVAGVKIGEVANVELNQEDFIAVLTMDIKNEYKLPKDSRASIWSKGLLGGKHIVITPGSLDEDLKDDDYIKYTQSAINLESLIGKLIYSINKQ